MSILLRTPPRASCLPAAVCAVLFLSCSTVLAGSVDGDAKDRAINLDAVVVTGQAPSSALTWVTDPRLPRQPVPASDGADYLKTVPGFTAIRNGGTNGDPVLRGMFGSRLNLLTNDGSMPGACPSRMDNPLSYVSPETFDSLVVIKGPQTVRWGPGASAGTVRFERRVDRFDQPGLRARGSLLGGSFGRNDQVVDVEAGIRSGYLRVNGNRSEADDYESGDGGVVPSSWRKWNADMAIGWTPDADTLFEASTGIGDGEARYAGRGMDGSQFDRLSHAVRFRRGSLGGALDAIEASAFLNIADHVMDNYSLRRPNPHGSMPMAMVSNVDRRTWGGRAAGEWRWGRFELDAGFDLQRSRHRRRGGMGRDVHLSQPWVRDAVFANVGGFAELGWTPVQGQRWVTGLRLDRAEASDERMQAGVGHGSMQMENPTHGLTRSESLRSGFVRHERDHGAMDWYVGIGHVERMPDYWELFSPGMGPMGSPNAFSGMEPEKTTQLDLGLHYRGERFDAWVSAYVGRIEDYILFTYRADGRTMARNVDAHIHGGEAGIEFRTGPFWRLGATLAHAWGENHDSGQPLPQMPPLEARLTANREGARWSVGALVRAVSSQGRVAPGQGSVVGRDLGPSAGFATLAVNGGYRLGTRWRVAAGIDNLFNRAYSEHLNLAGSADFGYPADPLRIAEPGRSAWLKLDYVY